MAAALKHPEGALLFNLYVHQLCYYRWELSADWDRLRLVLETLHDSWAAARDQVEPADHDLGEAVLHFSGWLVPAMLQDSSVSSSCAASSRRRCEAVLCFLENTLRLVENVVTGPPALRSSWSSPPPRSWSTSPRCWTPRPLWNNRSLTATPPPSPR